MKLELINAVTSLVKISQPVMMANTFDYEMEDYKDFNYAQSKVIDVYTENKDFLLNFVREITSKTTLSSKQFNAMNMEEKAKLFFKVLNSYKEQGLITKSDVDLILLHKDQFVTKVNDSIKNGITSYANDYFKNLREIKTEIGSYYDRLVTDNEKNYSVNIDGSASTKDLFSNIEKIKELAQLVKSTDINERLEFIKKIRTVSASINAIVILGSLTSGIASFLSIITGGALVGAAYILGISISALSSVSSLLETWASMEENNVKNINSFAKIFANLDEYTPEKLKFKVTKTAFKKGVVLTQSVMLLYKNSKVLNTNALKPPSIATPILQASGAFFASAELAENLKRVELINNAFVDLEAASDRILKLSKFLDDERWVVVNETPQTNSYNLGGVGGENTVFRNIKTGEEKSISEMLKMSKFELRFYKLTKVFDKNKGWYIKSLPNKTKEDNLG